jgi:hypothetical protein
MRTLNFPRWESLRSHHHTCFIWRLDTIWIFVYIKSSVSNRWGFLCAVMDFMQNLCVVWVTCVTHGLLQKNFIGIEQHHSYLSLYEPINVVCCYEEPMTQAKTHFQLLKFRSRIELVLVLVAFHLLLSWRSPVNISVWYESLDSALKKQSPSVSRAWSWRLYDNFECVAR